MTATEAKTPTLCVVGTMAFDDIETPHGSRTAILGGSATYFGVASSYFTDVGASSVVGEDFPAEFRAVLETHGIDLSGVEVKEGGRTFHWAGRYAGTMDQAETLVTDLNVLLDFNPILPPAFRKAPYVFLANTDPAIQLKVIDQLEDPQLVVMDTMNLWIDIARENLERVLQRVDGLMINDAEARQLTGESNLIVAGKAILRMGPRFVIVKKGEHGSFLFSADRLFALPSYPLDTVVDPTGAGDSFAGGTMGYLASVQETGIDDICRAMVHGTVVASFTCSDFSLDRLAHIDRPLIDARVQELQDFVRVP